MRPKPSSSPNRPSGPRGSQLAPPNPQQQLAQRVNTLYSTPELLATGRPPNNPWPGIKAQFDQGQEENLVLSNSYQDWSTKRPSTARYVVVEPTSNRFEGPPIAVEDRGMLQQQGGPLSNIPQNPIAMQPGLPGEQMANLKQRPAGPFSQALLHPVSVDADPGVASLLAGRGAPSASQRRPGQPLGSREAKMQAAQTDRMRQQA